MDKSYISEEKYYNSFLRQYIYINEGEQLCTKCNGKGKVPKSQKKFGIYTKMLVCNECLGDGKIDWVEEVVGKKRKVFYGNLAATKM